MHGFRQSEPLWTVAGLWIERIWCGEALWANVDGTELVPWWDGSGRVRFRHYGCRRWGQLATRRRGSVGFYASQPRT